MKVAAIEVERYCLPLRSPLSSPAGPVTERRGLIVRVDAAGGGKASPAVAAGAPAVRQDVSGTHAGLGEAAPAYWLGGTDSIELAADEIESVRLAVDAGGCDLGDVVDAAARLRSPSARCALETAALDLVARRRGVALAALLAALPVAEGDPSPTAEASSETAALDLVARRRGVALAALPAALPVAEGDPATTAGTSSETAAGPGPATSVDSVCATGAATDERTAATIDAATGTGCELDRAETRAVTPVPGKSVEVAALCVSETVAELAAEVAELAGLGFRTFKLKVGRRDPSEDLERIAAVQRAMPAGGRLRLDANRAWSLDEARRFLSVAGRRFRECIEYVEEPLARPAAQDLARLARDVDLAVALDESVGCPADLEALASAGGVAVVVLKLARTGGPSAAVALADAAARIGVRAVVTDSIESRVGRAAAVHTAVAVAVRAGRAGSGVVNVPAVGLGGALLLAGEPAGSGAGRVDPRHAITGPGLSVPCG